MQQRDRAQRRIVFPERAARMVLAATPHIGVAQGFYPEILIDFKKRAKIAVDASRNSRFLFSKLELLQNHARD